MGREIVIPIFIPFVNREDLLRKAIDSIPCNDSEWQIEVINNSGKSFPDVAAADCNPPVPLTFTQTQNWMLRIAQSYSTPFYLFMHSDAEAMSGTIEKLVKMAQTETHKWGVIFTNYDALAAFNTEAFNEVGGWDTILEWYLADSDMYRRLRLAGYECIDSGLEVKHEPSQTIRADPMTEYRVLLHVPLRKHYYLQKWGGLPGEEKFEKAFNGLL